MGPGYWGGPCMPPPVRPTLYPWMRPWHHWRHWWHPRRFWGPGYPYGPGPYGCFPYGGCLARSLGCLAPFGLLGLLGLALGLALAL